ncbi:hypothetical protein PR048_027986 [Dryococelus australis]|uniref:Uncharacterized protein n=1 Tax=Dryococelus australis TaxID=614101 RepID=A0ABQ9GI37_9NEOP|nr:hypothetical protein PR048_027986 [Dryococelus australis]
MIYSDGGESAGPGVKADIGDASKVRCIPIHSSRICSRQPTESSNEFRYTSPLLHLEIPLPAFIIGLLPARCASPSRTELPSLPTSTMMALLHWPVGPRTDIGILPVTPEPGNPLSATRGHDELRNSCRTQAAIVPSHLQKYLTFAGPKGREDPGGDVASKRWLEQAVWRGKPPPVRGKHTHSEPAGQGKANEGVDPPTQTGARHRVDFQSLRRQGLDLPVNRKRYKGEVSGCVRRCGTLRGASEAEAWICILTAFVVQSVFELDSSTESMEATHEANHQPCRGAQHRGMSSRYEIRLNHSPSSTLDLKLVVRLLASHQGEPGLTPSRVAPGFLHVGIVLDDTAGQQVFSGISHLPHPCILALFHIEINWHFSDHSARYMCWLEQGCTGVSANIAIPTPLQQHGQATHEKWGGGQWVACLANPHALRQVCGCSSNGQMISLTPPSAFSNCQQELPEQDYICKKTVSALPLFHHEEVERELSSLVFATIRYAAEQQQLRLSTMPTTRPLRVAISNSTSTVFGKAPASPNTARVS